MIPSGGATATEIRLTVRNTAGFSSHSWPIDLDFSRYQRWGLGENLTEMVSNNVSYEWHMSQANTGPYWSVNCAPACVTMAIKWANPNFTKTVEEARNTYPNDGQGWTWAIQMAYLSDNRISHSLVRLPNENVLKSQIDSGHIVILAMNTSEIRFHTGNPEWRIDRYYAPPISIDFWHAVIVKGHRVVDDILWFEIYEPAPVDYRYADGTLKGRGRFWRSEDIMIALVSHSAFLAGMVPNVLVVRRR